MAKDNCAQPNPDDDGVDLRLLIRSLAEHFWVLALLLVVGLATVVTLMYVDQPGYVSEALLLVDEQYLGVENAKIIIAETTNIQPTVSSPKSYPGGVLKLRYYSQNAKRANEGLQADLDSVLGILRATIPDYIEPGQEFADTFGTEEGTIEQLWGIQTKVIGAARAFQVVRAPTLPTSKQSWFDGQKFALAGVFSFLIGCIGAVLWDQRHKLLGG